MLYDNKTFEKIFDHYTAKYSALSKNFPATYPVESYLTHGDLDKWIKFLFEEMGSVGNLSVVAGYMLGRATGNAADRPPLLIDNNHLNVIAQSILSVLLNI